jgi:hypothetical protein
MPATLKFETSIQASEYLTGQISEIIVLFDTVVPATGFLSKHTLFKSQPHFLAGPCKSFAIFSIARCKGKAPMYLVAAGSCHHLCCLVIFDIVVSKIGFRLWTLWIQSKSTVCNYSSSMACRKRKECEVSLTLLFFSAPHTRMNGLRNFTLRGRWNE